MHNPESVPVNETLKNLWDFEIQTDHLVQWSYKAFTHALLTSRHFVLYIIFFFFLKPQRSLNWSIHDNSMIKKKKKGKLVKLILKGGLRVSLCLTWLTLRMIINNNFFFKIMICIKRGLGKVRLSKINTESDSYFILVIYEALLNQAHRSQVA